MSWSSSCWLWSQTSLNVMLLTFSYKPQSHDHVVYGLVQASKSQSCMSCLWSRTSLKITIMLSMVSYKPQSHDHVVLSMVSYKPQSHYHVVYGLVQASKSLSCCLVYGLVQASKSRSCCLWSRTSLNVIALSLFLNKPHCHHHMLSSPMQALCLVLLDVERALTFKKNVVNKQLESVLGNLHNFSPFNLIIFFFAIYVTITRV